MLAISHTVLELAVIDVTGGDVTIFNNHRPSRILSAYATNRTFRPTDKRVPAAYSATVKVKVSFRLQSGLENPGFFEAISQPCLQYMYINCISPF